MIGGRERRLPVILVDGDGGRWEATYDQTDWGVVVFTSGEITLRAVGGRGFLAGAPARVLELLEEVRARG